MDKQMSMSFFTDELAEVKTHKKDFLGQMNQLIPWSEWVVMISRAITRESAAISPMTSN